MSFRDWLKLDEVGTGTSCVAVFSRPIFSEPFTRTPIEILGEKKRKRKKTLDLNWKLVYPKENNENMIEYF